MRLPKCPECGDRGTLVTGQDLYSHRPDLYKKRFYICKEHDTRVGCHGTTKNPLGFLMAGAQLRLLRSQVHGMFDPLWRNGHFHSRNIAYLWFATQMELSTAQCHVSNFNENQCHKAISILHSYCSELQAAAHKEVEETKWKSKIPFIKENQ